MVKHKAFVTFIFLAVFSALSFAQEKGISVKASVDSSHYQIGDYINYKITVQAPKGVTVQPPALKDSLSGVDLLKIESPAVNEQKDNSTNNIIYSFILSKYDSGGVRIPPVAVFYSVKGDTAKRSALTNQVNFTVSTLNVKKDAEIKDIKDPIKIPLDWKLILLWVLLGLLVLGAVFYLIMYYRKKKAQRAGIIKVIKKEPHEMALDQLKALEAKKLWQSGKIKEYHSEITEIIRRYFEDRFHIPALESTTNELLFSLKSASGNSKIIDITSDFLNNADLVKFAKFVPMNDINEEMMRQAYNIVNLTIPDSSEPLSQSQERANA